MKADGQAVAVTDDSGEIKVFGFDDGKLLKLTNNGHATSITAVQIAPDGRRVVSGDSQGGVMIWDLD